MSDETPRRVSVAIVPDTEDRLRMPLSTVACWRLGDGVFRFDHKLIGPQAKEAFAEFWRIRDRHPSAPIALFGHADIKGDDDYNHRLAAERAQAVMGVLDGSVDLWFELFDGDREGLRALQGILRDYGLEEPEEGFGPRTREAVGKYFEDLCGGRRLEVWDYLDDGLRAMQSCSELNPVVRPSRDLLERLSDEDRARLEAVNRRVVAYFFEPGTHVGDRWPCPVAGEGIDGCKKRLWSDAKARRATPSEPLQYWPATARGRAAQGFSASERTFACRFYDRLARGRGCELVDPWRPPVPVPPPEPPTPDVDDPPKDPDPPKEEPKDPDEWVVLLSCEHHGHVNRRSFMTEGTDYFQLVPPSDGDRVTMLTEPLTEVVWERPGEELVRGETSHWYAPSVPIADPKPWDLIAVRPLKRPVIARTPLRAQWCMIDLFPHAQYSFDFEDVRVLLREKVWSYPLAVWDFLGDMVADEFELRVMEKGDFGGHFKMQWREHSDPSGSDERLRDHRAYLGYWLNLYADPLASCYAKMSVSLAWVFGKLRKFSIGRKILDKLPKKVLERAESVAFKGAFRMEGGGAHDIRVDEPGKVFPPIGTGEPGAAVVEFTARFDWKGDVEFDFDELVFGDEDEDLLGSLTLSATGSMDVLLGLVLDVPSRRIGAYVEAKFYGFEFVAEIDLPGEAGDGVYETDRQLAQDFERITLMFDF